MTTAMPSATELLAALDSCPVLGIVRAADADEARARLMALRTKGLRVMEVSLATPNAFHAVEALVASDQLSTVDREVLIGVGTVMTARELVASFEAGAAFAVTPIVNAEVLAAASQRGMPVIVGACTPTEIQQAWSAGAAAVKLFPASLWTLRAFGDLRTVFPTVPFVPTGGVRADEVAGWLTAGARAVGVGSALTDGHFDLAQLP